MTEPLYERWRLTTSLRAGVIWLRIIKTKMWNTWPKRMERNSMIKVVDYSS